MTHDTTPGQEVEAAFARLRQQPGFDRAREALAAADRDRNGRLSYTEYEQAQLSGPWRQRIDALEAQMVQHYHDGCFGGLVRMFARNDLGRVNDQLSREGLPSIDMSFVRASLRAHPRQR